MIIELTGVKRDGMAMVGTVKALHPYVQAFTMPRAEDATLKLKIQRPNRAAADITGSIITFALRKNSEDALPLVSRQGVITNAAGGLVEVLLVPGDTLALSEKSRYVYDVQLLDSAGKRWQIVPESEIEISPIISHPADPVTVPAASSSVLPWLSLSEGLAEVSTDLTTTELLVFEWAANLDDVVGSLPNVLARLSAIARVTGGTGTLRIRSGGTAGAADGTALITSDPIVGLTSAAVTKTATVAKPVGVQLLKLTAQNNTAGQRTYVRGATFAARGAV